MTWQPTVRGPEALAIYAAAEQDRTARPERYRFDADQIIERATKRGRLPVASFAPGWEQGLEAFLRSAHEEGRLNAVGIRMALQTATGRLSAGAEIANYRRDHPAAATLPPPIVIIGGWRTGTTFLFRLLGSDPRLRAPLPAELAAPWLCADGAPDSEITSAASQLLHTLNPDMAFVHPSGPTLPEECVLGMGTDMRNWGFTSMLRLPSYAAWLAQQDLAGTYDRYRESLQLLASPDDDRRFVLKAPAHTAELDHLADTFPGAVVVQIHRDIVETLASGASLFAVYRSTYSDDVDPIEVGRHQLDQSELWLRRAVDYRRSRSHLPVTFVDIDYKHFIADPVACLTTVYNAADMASPPQLDKFIDAYHASHPQSQGRHRYAPEDFGIDPDAVRERFSFLPAP